MKGGSGEFEVVPAVDLRGGKCVQLRQGRKEEVIFSSAESPVEIARHWVEQGASRLHIIDLDGAFQETKNNSAVVKKIAESVGVSGVSGVSGERGRAKIQVGGGIRSYERAVELLALPGVERIIFGTAALKSPRLVERVAREFGSERVMVALDVRGGKVAVDGWRETTGLDAKEAAKQAEELGAGSLLFTNIDVEGLMQGVETEVVAEFVRSAGVPVVVAGGVSSAEDVERVREAGASGVVVGSALYTGKLSLEIKFDQRF
ncbi:1-(5-phosphoribosyl)-5-[(5-phosphoribosylamino)methylideneamino]imidazole-4-carboxamide isomerase [ANME-1 cluster archaeon ex4572_4]|nr:MAG: 1-(5-phosphoribosyl)-5-[(5-phosphoribosylamino)methylideneamino]imidazole-4-carboxamide isomerase [ANME-1 cluster archaeon ex4572_4]